MTSRQAGLAIALATILVQAPRLVLALLAADRQPVGPGAQRALLVLAGIGTALVLTGGNLFLAHTVAHVDRWRRALTVAWLAVLVSSGGLVIPLLVAGLTARTLPEVLSAGHLEWAWAVLAAGAHELTAAGCVLASAAWARTLPADPAAGRRSAAAGVQPAHDAARTLPAEPAAQLRSRIACRAGCGRSFSSQQAEIAHYVELNIMGVMWSTGLCGAARWVRLLTASSPCCVR